MNRYERRLPHWDATGQPLFVTFGLHDSLPANRTFPPARLTTGKAFAAMDRILDTASTGPRFLARSEIACLIMNALQDGQARFRRYQLHAFVIMPNHVHLLVTPYLHTRRWLGPLKGFTAHEANRILGRCGEPFWQDESYDRLVRTDAEFHRIAAYIENNPVKAGLAQTPDSFPWSSAYVGQPFLAAAAFPGGAPQQIPTPSPRILARKTKLRHQTCEISLAGKKQTASGESRENKLNRNEHDFNSDKRGLDARPEQPERR